MSALNAQLARLRRHRHRRRQLRRDPVADHVGAREHVAEPLALLAEDRGDHGGNAPQHVDLDDAQQPTGERVPERDGSRVVTHRAQPGRHLAETSTAGESLDGDRVRQPGDQKQTRTVAATSASSSCWERAAPDETRVKVTTQTMR